MENIVISCALGVAIAAPFLSSNLVDERDLAQVGFDGAPISVLAPEFDPPLPICGTYQSNTVYGPIERATTQTLTCQIEGQETGEVYQRYHHYKKKIIYNNGYEWRCYDSGEIRCSGYLEQTCPDDTCAPLE